MITKDVLPKQHRIGDLTYRFTEKDKTQILEEGGFIDTKSVEMAIRLDLPYYALRKTSIARGS